MEKTEKFKKWLTVICSDCKEKTAKMEHVSAEYHYLCPQCKEKKRNAQKLENKAAKIAVSNRSVEKVR